MMTPRLSSDSPERPSPVVDAGMADALAPSANGSVAGETGMAASHDAVDPSRLGDGTEVPESTVDQPRGSGWSLPPMVQTLLDHPWFGTVGMGAPTTASSPEPEAFSLNATGPLAWWWAPAATLPFKVQADRPSSAVWNDRIARCPDALDGCLTQTLAWLERPLVWREHAGTVQAVLLGHHRVTFSEASPAGVFETIDTIRGWRPCDPTTVLQLLRTCLDREQAAREGLAVSVSQRVNLHAGSLEAIVQGLLPNVARQTSRAVQQASGARRLHLWRQESTLVTRDRAFDPGMDPVPFASQPWSLWPDSVVAHALRAYLPDHQVPAQAVARTSRIAYSIARTVPGFLATLARHVPVWRTWRRSGSLRHLLTGWVDPLGDGPTLLAWHPRMVEHPNADLMMALALLHRRPADPHVWQETLWVPTVFAQPAAWRYALRGPRATVRTVMRLNHPSVSSIQVLNVLATLPEAQGALPSLVWRSIPATLWEWAGDAGSPRQDWARRMLRALLKAAGQRPWADRRQGQGLPGWCLMAQATLEWLLTLDRCPVEGPSWTWATMMDLASSHADAAVSEWNTPLRAGWAMNARITPIVSTAQAHLVGTVLRNCLDDVHGRKYLMQGKAGTGLLYRLDLHGHRTVLSLKWGGRGWTVQEHGGVANTAPPPAHQALAARLLEFHRRLVLPQNQSLAAPRVKPVEESWKRLRMGTTTQGDDHVLEAVAPDLLALFDEAWHRGTTGGRGQGGGHPVRRLWNRWSLLVHEVAHEMDMLDASDIIPVGVSLIALVTAGGLVGFGVRALWFVLHLFHGGVPTGG